MTPHQANNLAASIAEHWRNHRPNIDTYVTTLAVHDYDTARQALQRLWHLPEPPTETDIHRACHRIEQLDAPPSHTCPTCGGSGRIIETNHTPYDGTIPDHYRQIGLAALTALRNATDQHSAKEHD